MGENKHIKELDAFAKKYIKDIEPKKTSVDFTTILMGKINAEVKSSVFKTKSLISKKVWVFLILAVVALVLFSLNVKDSSVLEIPSIDFSIVKKLSSLNIYRDISLSSTMFYAILFFGLMFLAQIFYLKRYFDKRIS